MEVGGEEASGNTLQDQFCYNWKVKDTVGKSAENITFFWSERGSGRRCEIDWEFGDSTYQKIICPWERKTRAKIDKTLAG